MKQLLYSCILLMFASTFPLVAFAQLSSTNYQVDVQYVAEEGGGYATSTSYQLEGSEGSPYEYLDTPETPGATGGATTGSRSPSGSGTSTLPTGGVPGTGENVVNGTPTSVFGETQSDEGMDTPETTESGSRGQDGENQAEDVPGGESLEEAESLAPTGNIFLEIFLEHKFLYSSVFSLIILLIILSIVLYLRSREE